VAGEFLGDVNVDIKPMSKPMSPKFLGKSARALLSISFNGASASG
jgi:hypothetical protein